MSTESTEALLARIRSLDEAIKLAPLALAFELSRQRRAAQAEVDLRVRQAGGR